MLKVLQTDYAFWTIEEEGAWVIRELDEKTYVLELIWTVNTSLQRDNVDLNS